MVSIGSDGTAATSIESRDAKPILEATGIAVHYGGIRAVDGVDLRLSDGKIFGILGPNGCGKSTLLGAISRLTPLTQGALSVNGQDYSRTNPAGLARLGIARTFQTVRLLEDLTVYENVALGADTLPGRQIDGQSRASWIASLLDLVGLSALRRYRPSELSYGAQRKVEIARALAIKPKILLLDEPSAGMNQAERREMSTTLRTLSEHGLTQLLVEHDVQMMLDTCDSLLAMNLGKIVCEGEPQAVVKDPIVLQSYLGRRWQSHA